MRQSKDLELNKANEYLTTWYGNWEIVPDDKDKWHHYVSEFYIP